jgi:hypothetical protein
MSRYGAQSRAMTRYAGRRTRLEGKRERNDDVLTIVQASLLLMNLRRLVAAQGL